MARCPSCSTQVGSPVKVFPVLGEMDKAGVFAESKVGIYECPKCSKRFPSTFSRLDLQIVEARYLDKLKEDLARANSLNKELIVESATLKEEGEKFRKTVEIMELEARVDALDREIGALKYGRDILEDEIASAVPRLGLALS